MSREIKFRAWHKEANEYRTIEKIDFDYFEQKGLANCITTRDYDTHHDPWDSMIEEVELEQYTGLKDKNGKEIYEGDIIKDTSDGDCLINSVFWCEKGGFWGVKPRSPFADRDWGWFIGRDDIEVVGNIHENSELLEGI